MGMAPGLNDEQTTKKGIKTTKDQLLRLTRLLKKKRKKKEKTAGG